MKHPSSTLKHLVSVQKHLASVPKHPSFVLCVAILSQLTLLLPLSAQNAEFRYHGAALPDGATVTIYAEQDEWGDDGEMLCETNPSSAPADGLILANLTATALKGSATLTIHDNTLAPYIVQWCMGSECVRITGNGLADKPFTLPASSYILTQFDANYPAQYGELNATIVAMVGLQQLTVHVRFVYADPAAPLTFPRRSVVEEYTGTWCGNCPLGIVGLQNLARDYGERAIPIAVHSGDEMELNTYVTAGLVPNGVPECTIDRGAYMNPYTGTQGGTHYGINRDFEAAQAIPAEAAVALTAQFSDAAQSRLACNVTTTFGINSDTAPYAIALVITEDGLTGTGSKWMQENYFATDYKSGKRDFTDADMDYWYTEAPAKVGGMTYNHVAVATQGIKSGVAGSVKAPLVKGASQDYAYTFYLGNNKVIQDKTRLTAVAMLINTTTNRIVNAATATVLPYGTDAIDALATPAPATPADTRIYDLSGRQHPRGTLPRGLYITGGRTILVK